MGTNDFVDPKPLLRENYEIAVDDLMTKFADRQSWVDKIRFRRQRRRLRRLYLEGANRFSKW